METDKEEKNLNDAVKVNDDVLSFMRKRSETEAPKYAARLKPYVELQQKRRRAAAARRNSEHQHREKKPSSRTVEADQNEKGLEKNTIDIQKVGKSKVRSHCGLSGEHPGKDDDRIIRRRGDKCAHDATRTGSRSHSGEPSEACGRRRKRRSCSCRRRRRRRKSCGRKRRRRRSCRRRRRRSCSRRRRRRSCRRRRTRRRRRRRC